MLPLDKPTTALWIDPRAKRKGEAESKISELGFERSNGLFLVVYKTIFTVLPVSGSKLSDLVVNGQVADLAGSSDMEIGGDTGIGRKLMKHYQSSYHCVHRYYWGSEMVWNTPQGCASKGVRELGYLSSNPCSSLVDSCSWGVSSPALPACPACRLRMLLQPEQGLIQGLQ